MKPFKIFLGGLNSTGKTSLTNTLTTMCSDVSVCHGSREFFKWLRLKEGDYGKLEEMSEVIKDQELSNMICHFIDKINASSDKIWIFTGHFGRINGKIIKPAVGEWISQFDLIILLFAEPKVLIDRVVNDSLSGIRLRGKLTSLITSLSNSVDVFLSLLRQTDKITEDISIKYGVPLLKLDSSRSDSVELSLEILKFIKKA